MVMQGKKKSGVPCRDVRACVCVCARTHQANRDHASPAAGFEILPHPSMKNPWSSDLKPLESFYAEINFSIIEGVLGKGSACQPPCPARAPDGKKNVRDGGMPGGEVVRGGVGGVI